MTTQAFNTLICQGQNAYRTRIVVTPERLYFGQRNVLFAGIFALFAGMAAFAYPAQELRNHTRTLFRFNQAAANTMTAPTSTQICSASP